ncbi:3',5'-cyclic-nucleotide phosphodiesterase [Neosynechococcus sphagnicola sy1]|uniref:3',5'-cyclic-nucleotide phosphodiesterase n=1 Tax=Neosynechococcus sphagnicola sy1 TaxID=1497020 RepID=A0A098TK42_9CYAN|nr:3',5'-cyclic-AMP phosphodiesterase [Neosynechococcus sphagnicola]KGF72705.1 3',5'-cyclic-nucleotide phosphodiesterase [Neosynechococcus sphagnicola sy1]
MLTVPTLLVAQITDLHLFAAPEEELLGLPTCRSFETVIEAVQQLHPQPDLLLLTGDLSQDGSLESYEHLKSLLSPLGIPTYWLPGNHDDQGVMQQVLTSPPFSNQKSFTVKDWRFLLLNSGVPHYVHGEVSREQLNWLDQELQRAAEQPTLVSLHHPPFVVHSDWLDGSILRNPADLFAVIARHPQVKLVIFGHIHQEFDRQWQQVRFLGTPSTCIQFMPRSTQFSLDETRPGFRLLRLHPDGSWETQVERVLFEHQRDLTASGY